MTENSVERLPDIHHDAGDTQALLLVKQQANILRAFKRKRVVAVFLADFAPEVRHLFVTVFFHPALHLDEHCG
jgi:hypothetical protein